MPMLAARTWPLAFFLLLTLTPALALDPTPRQIPAHDVPVPATASAGAQALIGAPYPPFWNAHPRSAAEWKALVASDTANAVKAVAALRERFKVKSDPAVIAGVNVFILTPDSMPEENRNRVLVHLHGDGWLGDAARLYANGTDLKDPMLSPIYGDFRGFPPAILTTGTRDLFLSNTVRTQRKLLAAGVEAKLIIFEGLSHAQYLFDPAMPESKEHFAELAAFFDAHLNK